MRHYDILRDAFEFALKWHGDQKYASEHPYIVHLYDVVQVLIEFGYRDETKILCAAWLHDVIEDTPCNYSNIESKFGYEIADIVYAVTDELGKNRDQRKEKTFPKLNGYPSAQIVKLADWIANVRQCYRNKHKMFKRYKKDYNLFVKYMDQAVDGRMRAMWDTLSDLLDRHSNHFNEGIDTYHSEFDG